MNTLSLRPSFSPSIYSEVERKTVTGSIVLEDNILKYFMNIIDQNSAAVSVDVSLLTEQNGKDISFDFDVYSSKTCTLNFDGFSTKQYTLLRGLTSFRVTRYGGQSQWVLTLKSEDYQRTEERVFKCATDTPVLDNYYVCDRTVAQYAIFGYTDVNNFHNADRWNIYGDRKIYIHSAGGILLTTMQINVNIGWEKSYDYPTSIKIYGSNDMNVWTIIGSDMSPSYVKGKKYLINMNYEGNTYFRHFRIEFGVGTDQNNCYLPRVYFFGIKDENISYTYKRIIPYMTANPQAGAQAIFDDTNITSLNNFPRYWFPKYPGESIDCYAKWLDGDMSKPLTFYVKVNEARIPALFSIRHYREYEWCPVRFWKLYGSNSETVENEGDDETLDTFKSKTWTLIRVNQNTSYQYDTGEEEYHAIDCDTAYKYYKFEAITTYDREYWRHSGIMLYYKDYEKIPAFDSLVPILNSNSQDGYMLNCSSESDGTVYRAFDRNPDTYCGGAFTNGEWSLITKMAARTIIKTLSMTAASDRYDRMPIQFVIEGSNDFTTWDVLFTNNNEDPWLTPKETRSWNFENSTSYLWYRLRVLRTLDGNYVRISDISWGVQEKITGNSYYTEEYLVPVMSANSQDGYVVSSKSQYSNDYAPWKAFDRNSGDCWVSNDSDMTDSNKECDTWIQVQLPTAKVINLLNIVARAGSDWLQAPSSFVLKGSNNGSDWTSLLTVTDEAAYTNKSWDVTNTTSYSYYRLDITKTNIANVHISAAEINLVSRTYHDTLEGE